MAIKKYVSEKDNTITNAFKEDMITRGTGSNMGSADIIEVFSIYGQMTESGSLTGFAQTQELSRVLVQFPITTISADRSAGLIPASGNVDFYLRLYNAKHSYTTPKQAKYMVSPISADWEEGIGMDMDQYTDKTKDYDGSNWIRRTGSTSWTNMGGDYLDQHAKTQTLENGTEDLEVDISFYVEQWIKGAGSGGFTNYGVGVRLTSSQEAYFSSSNSANISSSIFNPSGAVRSYYTKKFFSRTSEFFFKRPVIEARWDSSIRDDRAKANYSSSLLTAEDNLKTLYLYNYINGELKNIPNITSPSDKIFVKLFSGSSDNSAPSGSAFNLVTSTDFTISGAPTVITGGYVSTGIYSASFALTSAATPVQQIFDVWYLNDGGSPNAPGAPVHTGSFEPYSHVSLNQASKPEFIFNISNLRDSYLSDENARFKIYLRQKDWNPTIYSKANANTQNYVLDNVYYKITRVADGYPAITFGTGSAASPQSHLSAGSYTRVSYDVSGSYFDLDMKLLEPGYMYNLELLYFCNNRYDKAGESFKFKVESGVT